MARAIVQNPAIMLGKPTFEGTRVTVECVLELLATGATVREVAAGYPRLDEEDVQNAVRYAIERLPGAEATPHAA